MAEALVLWMRGRIHSDEFDDLLEKAMDLSSRPALDAALSEIYACLWATYDDFTDHYIRVGPWTWARLRRCLAFLRSDLPYRETRGRVAHRWIPFLKVREPSPSYWPFSSQSEWRAHTDLLDGQGLPPSEPWHVEALRTLRVRATS